MWCHTTDSAKYNTQAVDRSPSTVVTGLFLCRGRSIKMFGSRVAQVLSRPKMIYMNYSKPAQKAVISAETKSYIQRLENKRKDERGEKRRRNNALFYPPLLGHTVFHIHIERAMGTSQKKYQIKLYSYCTLYRQTWCEHFGKFLKALRTATAVGKLLINVSL